MLVFTNFIIRESDIVVSFECAQIYHSVSRKCETSVSDLATLALMARSTAQVLSGLGAMKARFLWTVAQDL
jgi:predicted transcriptional regulator